MIPDRVSDTFGLNQACRSRTCSVVCPHHPSFTSRHFLCIKCGWNGKKKGFISNLQHPPPPVCLCRGMMQSDNYLIPTALYHVSGSTKQAVRTRNESVADRPDRAATGDRGQQRDRERPAECVSEARLRRADLGLRARRDISPQVWT